MEFDATTGEEQGMGLSAENYYRVDR